MTKAHINIGSNLGDRHALIELAVARIESALGCRAQRSAIIESEPWGFESPNAFLNMGISIECDDAMTPHALLDILQCVEKTIDASSHRNAAGGYADRAIDIDLIALGSLTACDEKLTLPHPRMQQREFVLRPMEELEPEWHHPVTGLTPAEMLERLH